MSRPTIEQLYGIDPMLFNNDCIHQFYTIRIEALKERKKEIAEQMVDETDYEKLSAANSQYKYVCKALEANEQDYEEIFK